MLKVGLQERGGMVGDVYTNRYEQRKVTYNQGRPKNCAWGDVANWRSGSGTSWHSDHILHLASRCRAIFSHDAVLPCVYTCNLNCVLKKIAGQFFLREAAMTFCMQTFVIQHYTSFMQCQVGPRMESELHRPHILAGVQQALEKELGQRSGLVQQVRLGGGAVGARYVR